MGHGSGPPVTKLPVVCLLSCLPRLLEMFQDSSLHVVHIHNKHFQLCALGLPSRRRLFVSFILPVIPVKSKIE